MATKNVDQDGLDELDQLDQKPSKKKDKPEHPTSIAAAVALLTKKYGEGTIIQGEKTIVRVTSWPSGIATLDKIIGCGGIPRGRIIEVYGPESSGKTTLTLTFAATCQHTWFRADGKVDYGPKPSASGGRLGNVAFIDAEHALDPTWANNIGVDLDRLIINQPNCGEEAVDVASMLVKSGEIDLVIVDSVAALVPKAEIEGDMEEQHLGAQARLMSKAMRKLSSDCSATGTTVVFINQIREKIGVTFGSNETTPGGRALKFFSSVRIDIRAGEPLSEQDRRVGRITKVKLAKNKVGMPFRNTAINIMYGYDGIYGIDRVDNLINAAIEAGLVVKNGSFYSYGKAGDPERCKVHGIKPMIAAIKDNQVLFRQLSREYHNMIYVEPVHLDTLPDEELIEVIEEVIEDD